MGVFIGYLNRLAFEFSPIFYKLVWMSLTAVVIGFVVLVIRHFGEKRISPLWKYLLWGVVLFALLIPYRFPSSISLMPISIEQEVSYRQSYDLARMEWKLANQEAITQEDHAKVKKLEEKENRLFQVSLAVDVFLPWVWVLGMLFLIVYLLAGRWHFLAKVKKNSRRLEPDSREYLVMLEAKKRLGITQEVEILMQSHLQSPALLSGGKPLILLPEYVLDLKEESLRYILMHELAHWKRKDHWLNYLLLCLQVVYWFNPMVWLLFHAIRNDMEVLNDEYVLKEIGWEHQKHYSYSLVEVLAHANRISGVPKLLCMVDGKKNVERRIKMMKQGGYFRKNKKSIAIMGGIMVLTLAILFLTQMPPKRESKEPAVSTFKGLEIYLGKEDGKTYYNLLSGTNREKTEEEKYNPATAETNIGEVIKFISKQGEGLHVWLIPDGRTEDPRSSNGVFSEFEVENIAMHLRESLPKNSTLEVVMPKVVGKKIRVDVPADTEKMQRYPLDKITFSFFQDNGKRELTPAEVEEVRIAFEQLIPHPKKDEELFINPICHFFNSYYDRPEEMDLWEFTWYLPGEELLSGNETDEAEFAKIRESGINYFVNRELKDTITPVRRVPRDFVDSMLLRYMDITSDDITNRGETLYLGEPYDNFYIASSDMGVGFFECSGGEINGDELKLTSENAVLMLKRVEDRYLIVAHQRKG